MRRCLTQSHARRPYNGRHVSVQLHFSSQALQMASSIIFYLAVFCLLVILVVLWLWQRCTYWRRHGVSGPRGVPIFGNMFEYFIGRKHYGAVYQDIYDAHPDLAYIGIQRLFNEPALLLRSQELVKEVMIGSFQHFQDNVLHINRKRDPIVIYNPFVAKGELWKSVRGEILPIFTPNKLLSRYTLDVIASAAYGLDGRALSKNKSSDFVKLVQSLFLPNNWSLIETTALLFSPILGNIIRYRYAPLALQHWLRSIIGKVLEQKFTDSDGSAMSKDVTQKSNDFLQWLIDAKEKSHEALEATRLIGHAATFLLEGFETPSTTMAFALYEYGKNPLVQLRVQQEIDEVLLRHDGEISYEALQEMSYLGATIYETLRLYPVMAALLKECTKKFQLPPNCEGGKAFEVPIGMVCVVPVKALHYDADIYPEPLKFKPERFLDQADKASLFLGFGEGPRMCPGMRFALVMCKAGLVTLLSKYKIELATDAQPFKMSPTTFLTATQNGIWLKFRQRK